MISTHTIMYFITAKQIDKSLIALDLLQLRSRDNMRYHSRVSQTRSKHTYPHTVNQIVCNVES